jgi:hypothetical protein
MKRIFTLILVATALTTSAFAQGGSRDRDYDKNKSTSWNDNGKFDNDKFAKPYGGYVFTARERDMEISRINREFDQRIQALNRKFMMNRYQKQRQLVSLQEQRKDAIRAVNAKFSDRKNKYGDYGKRW